MATQTAILIGVFVYFGIGAFIACSMTALSLGFSGKFEWQVIPIFFFWPFIWLFQVPYLLLILIGLSVASLMTLIAWAALKWIAP